MGMALPNIGPFSPPSAAAATNSNTATSLPVEDPSKKVRKPYTITKSRESWTEPEHDKFLEALQLFDRDWKKIEAFVGSKTVIQIRSHAQKYFLKVQKSGTNEHLPPPRPKRKAAHPYPQKASKSGEITSFLLIDKLPHTKVESSLAAAPVLTQVATAFQAAPALPEPGFARRSETSPMVRHAVTGDMRSAGQQVVSNLLSRKNEINQKTKPVGEMADQGNISSLRVLPDFAQVYSFIGSVFDPNASGHVQKLKKMDRIDVETVLLLMRNLSINLTSPDFEDHRRLLSSYEIDLDKDDGKFGDGAIQDGLSKNAAQL